MDEIESAKLRLLIVKCIFAMIAGPIVAIGFFALPFIALTLTIKAIMARRTVGRRQILAALTGIEARLRILAATRTPPQT